MASYDIPIMTEAEFLRFRSKTQRLENGCLVWIGATKRGYGEFAMRGKVLHAHRLSWGRWYGCTRAPILHHRGCADPLCIEPSHLVASNHSTNVRAGSRTGTVAEGL